MANSLNELKQTLNIKTISVEWNDSFPDYMLKSTYIDTPIYNDVLELQSTLSEEYHRIKITRKGLYRLGLLAEMHNLELAYFVIDAINIELFFYPKLESTKQWLEIFKEHLTRRQFFNLVKSYNTIKQYNSMFEMASYFQLTSPERPLNYGKPNVIKLNNDYILIQYPNDVFSPTYRVIKPGLKFEQFRPSINYDNTTFDCITLDVDDKHFTGDSIKHLWDGNEKTINKIEIKHKDTKQTLDAQEGLLTIIKDDIIKNERNIIRDIPIEKFKRDATTKIILDKTFKDKRAILLSNGFIWYVDEYRFFNIKNIKGFENLNTDLFSMSSEKKGIILSLDENSIECVPSIVFEKIMFDY